jgi:hypothetical protein
VHFISNGDGQWRWAMAIDQTMIQKGSWGMDRQGTAIGNVMKEKGFEGLDGVRTFIHHR